MVKAGLDRDGRDCEAGPSKGGPNNEELWAKMAKLVSTVRHPVAGCRLQGMSSAGSLQLKLP